MIDVLTWIVDNINDNASATTIIFDTGVDLVISGGSAFVAGAIGTFAGSLAGYAGSVPGIIVGGIAGFVAGIGFYYAADVRQYNGKSARTWIKEWGNSIW